MFEKDLYYIDNMIIDDKKEKKEWHKHAFETKLENEYDIES